MKIHSLRAELVSADGMDGRTDRGKDRETDAMKLTVAFQSFPMAPKKGTKNKTNETKWENKRTCNNLCK